MAAGRGGGGAAGFAKAARGGEGATGFGAIDGAISFAAGDCDDGAAGCAPGGVVACRVLPVVGADGVTGPAGEVDDVSAAEGDGLDSTTPFAAGSGCPCIPGNGCPGC
jgi:hypothetical protein